MLNRTFKPFPTLKTERLLLRQLIIDDETAIFALRSDNEINKYLGRKPANSIADARNFIKNINENINKNDSVYWAIIIKDTNILIGTICLFSFSDENRTCEIGFELLINFQGQGFMAEALEKVIDCAFNTIKVKKIDAIFHKNNLGSKKLLERRSFADANLPDKLNSDLINYHLINSID